MSEINEKEIERRFEEISKFQMSPEAVAHDLERARKNLTELTNVQQPIRHNIWRMIIRSNFTRFAAAAASVIIMAGLLSRSTESTVWASINKAFEQVQYVHVVEWEIKSGNEQIKRCEYWVKKPDKFRGEYDENLQIDNGIEKIDINKAAKTAQLSDSQQKEFPQAKYMFAWVHWLREQDPNFANEVPVLTKIPEECTKQELVYDGQFKQQPNVQRDIMKFKIWVDAKTLLFIHMVAENPDLDVTMEFDFDYQEIPDEIFALNIPDGYKILPPPKQTIFSGIILDQDDKPVSGVEVHINTNFSTMPIIGTTNTNGMFVAKRSTESAGGRVQFPILIHAFRKDVPGEVAWTIIQDPEDKKELAWSVPDYGNVTVLIDPNAPAVWKCTGATGITLKMQPALQIAGKVTDKNGLGLSGAMVKLQNIRIEYKDKPKISVGGTTWIQTSTVTDKQGRYMLDYLPLFPKGLTLSLIASDDDYVSSDETALTLEGVSQQVGPDFALLKGGVTIKGIVKNKDGEPLACYAVWHSVNGKRIGQVHGTQEGGFKGTYVPTGRNGGFELINCPAMEGIAVTASGAGKFPNWDFHMKNWKLNRQFEYYNEKTVDIKYEQGKKEYNVEIVLDKASTTIQFEVKGTNGQPVEGAEVRLGTSSFDYTDNFKAITDADGKCVLNDIPWVKQVPRLEVHPKEDSNFNMLVSATLEFSENIKKYRVEIILQDKYKYIPSVKQVTVIPLSD
jgi:hypothetical protein